MQFLFQQQREQPNGYWLIQFQLSQTNELPYNFSLQLEDQTLQLFLQNGNRAQFLAQQALQYPEKHLPTFENNQAWCFWADLMAQLEATPPILLQASNLKIATLLGVAQGLKQRRPTQTLIALLYAESAFPFVIKPAQILFPDFPPEAIGACPLLEDWQIPNRLLSNTLLAGCFDGDFEQLDEQWQPPAHWQVVTL